MDIKCVVCGEPWDAWGVNHGDMSFWEANLFRAGAGCPGCKGEVPKEGPFEPKSLEDIENGDGDPMDRLLAYENTLEGRKPEWVEPAPIVLWKCDGCGVEVHRDLEASPDGSIAYDKAPLFYAVPSGSKANDWWSSHPFSREPEPGPEPDFKLGEGDKAHSLCGFCADSCADCGAVITDKLELDTYDEGCAFPAPGDWQSQVCVDCLEKYCSTCENLQESCTCEEYEDDQVLASFHTDHPEHEDALVVHEHGQRWISCGPCGAQWSVNMASKDGIESYPDFEQISDGDGWCLEHAEATENT